jgi:putative glutamine amidotransferase
MGTARPVVGICAAIESARWTVWDGVETNISQRTYSTNVADAGALPLLLPADEGSAEEPGQLLALLDGLILSGGSDIDPATYGAEPAPQTAGFRADRDRFELALARGALERDLPVLGICRGAQMLNIARGGGLQQQLDDEQARIHLHTPGRFTDHEIRLEPGSLAERAVGAERIAVRSHHHQALGELGTGIVASAWAEPGGLVEAIEVPDNRWALGILWHAEEEQPSPVIEALAEAAREPSLRNRERSAA